MARISIQSERFLEIYAELRPILERVDRQRQGFSRSIALQMEPFHVSQVIIALDELCNFAEQGIALAGIHTSHIIINDSEMRMITWVQALESQNPPPLNPPS